MTSGERLEQCRRVSSGVARGEDGLSLDEALVRAYVGFVLALLAACGFGLLAVGSGVWL